MSVRVGQMAPDFKMQALVGKEFREISLAEYRGKWVVLFFYPLDFTFVCPTEVTQFSDRHEEFAALDAVVVGGSTDSVFSHQAWTKQIGELKYPLFSDLTRETSRRYGVLMEEKGIALRGTFIVDPEGKLRWSVIHDLGVGRNTDEVLRVLQALQTGENCPVNWKPGQKTLGK
ncbi:MAG: peroxiredoxin [Candidatus Eisenbacteria bacterium]|nr:peroxiredoxin [Candidatus Eisenbacteria bacterium]